MCFSPRKSHWIPFVTTLACFFLSVPQLPAQQRGVENFAESPASFLVGSANFFDPESGTSRLEVFCKVANDQLQFIKEENGYRASFQVLCVVYNQKGRQVTGDVLSNTQWVGSYDQTNSRQEFTLTQFHFSLPPGEYRLSVWVENQHSKEIIRKETQATVPSFDGSSLMLSDLLLVDETGPVETQSGALANGDLPVVPRVDRIYSDLHPQLSFYFEIYDLSSDGPEGSFYEVVSEVADLFGEVVLVDSSTVLRQKHLSFGHRSLVITSLEEREYFLRLRVRDPETGRTAQRETPFTVRWSILGHVSKDYQEAIEQLRYIATADEYKTLKEAQGDERKEAWLKFWADRDPTPGTPENEMKDEYYRRIEYANAHFSVVGPGWKSDRGRVYIVYGRPDEIERHTMEIGLKPYEIWYYYNSNHRFYFVDESGYGDYRLVSWR